jgi:POT family proton-dependent oligopeptide transporter
VAIVLIGHIILVISSIPPVIAHPKGALGALCLAIIIMGLGTGGFKSNISPLVAEQQRHLRPFVSQTKSGERVVVDPILTTSRIYMVGFLLRVVYQRDGFRSSISISSSTLARWSARSP